MGMNQEKKTACTLVILKFVEEVYSLLVQQQHKQAERGGGWGMLGKFKKLMGCYGIVRSMSSVTSVIYTFDYLSLNAWKYKMYKFKGMKSRYIMLLKNHRDIQVNLLTS